jgi:hypothetical protein
MLKCDEKIMMFYDGFLKWFMLNDEPTMDVHGNFNRI